MTVSAIASVSCHAIDLATLIPKSQLAWASFVQLLLPAPADNSKSLFASTTDGLIKSAFALGSGGCDGAVFGGYIGMMTMKGEALLGLGHHHLAELVEVHGAGAVLVKLLQDALQLLVGEGGQQLPDEASQGLGGDVAQALLVVDPATKRHNEKAKVDAISPVT